MPEPSATSPSADHALRVFFRALWVARVPLASTVIALLIFWNLPQARDLFIEIKGSYSSGILFWIGFYALVGAAWLLPVYCATRLVLEAEGQRIGTGEGSPYHWLNFAIPAALVILCLLALIIGSAYSYDYLIDSSDPNVDKLARAHLLTIVLVTLVATVGFAVFAATSARRSFLASGHASPQIEPPSPGAPAGSSGIRAALSRVKEGFTTLWRRKDTRAYLFVLLIITVITPLLWILEPATVAGIFPRATLMPVLLGFWIAPLTLLGLASHRMRLPLIFFFLMFCGALDTFIDNHGIRVRKESAAQPRIDIKEAIEHWQRANGCQRGVPGKSCSRPIIVAAAGGASRAAFFTASVLGLLEDLSAKDKTLSPFGRQLFAISSVSGSSVASTTYLALRELVSSGPSEAILGRAHEAAADDGLWYGNNVTSAPASKKTPWKDALQIVLAGDFLSPVAAAWMFRDVVPIGALLKRDDRAIVLEKVWEDRFARVFKLEEAANPMLRSLSSYQPAADRWCPILYLNGSMVENGRRVIASPVSPSTPELPCRLDCYPEALTEFYTDAYDFHDLINGRTTAYEERDLDEERLIKNDVRLSSAALLSARFPAISPYGTIRNDTGALIGHIVDGGYFENNGALTAVDIMNGLKIIAAAGDPAAGRKRPCKYEPDDDEKPNPICEPTEYVKACKPEEPGCPKPSEKIWPLIVQISADPGTQSCEGKVVDPMQRIALPITESWRFFPSLMHIIDGVLGARVARGTHASELLSYTLDEDREGYFAAYDDLKPGFVHFRICPQDLDPSPNAQGAAVPNEKKKSSEVRAVEKGQKFRDVSMSWWLSKPVQAYIDSQLCNANNQAAFVAVLMALSTEVAKTDANNVDELMRLRKQLSKDVESQCTALETVNQSVSQTKSQ